MTDSERNFIIKRDLEEREEVNFFNQDLDKVYNAIAYVSRFTDVLLTSPKENQIPYMMKILIPFTREDVRFFIQNSEHFMQRVERLLELRVRPISKELRSTLDANGVSEWIDIGYRVNGDVSSLSQDLGIVKVIEMENIFFADSDVELMM